MSSPLEASLTGRFGRPLRHMTSVGSTNSEALAWLDEDPSAPEGAVVVADHQSAGRGRWGRRWVSAPNSSLLLSLVLRPPWAAERLGLLTVAAGLACARALTDVTGSAARLKWPNDVLMDGRKVGGILIETRVSGRRIDGVVVGIGINLDLPEGLPPEVSERATSLTEVVRRAGTQVPGRAAVLAAILRRLEEVSEDLGTQEHARRLSDEAAGLMDLFGREVDLRYADGRIERVKALRLLDDGALEIEGSDGRRSVEVVEIERVREAE